MTPRAERFAAHNKAHAVVAAGWHPKGRPDLISYVPPARCDRVRFTFEDRTQRTLTRSDLSDLLDANHPPRWRISK